MDCKWERGQSPNEENQEAVIKIRGNGYYTGKKKKKKKRQKKKQKNPMPKRGGLLKIEFWFHGKWYDNEVVI